MDMKRFFYDLCLDRGFVEGNASFIMGLGWAGLGVAARVANSSGMSAGAVGLDVLSCALIDVHSPSEVQKEARSALESGADVVVVYGGSEDVNRAASGCWEVDVIMSPEKGAGRDLPDQKSSGLDHIAAKFMAERGIAFGIDFSVILNSCGMGRARLMGKIRQNIMLAKKYGVPVVIASGAKDRHGLRSPMDLYSVGIALGMDPGLAKKAVSDYPAFVVKKAQDRRDPGIIMAGLKEFSVGDVKKSGGKKLFGWY